MAWLIASLATFIVLAKLSLASPLGITQTDSSVFEYVGMVLQHGGTPYVDTFDHKGPLLYLINWMGMELAGWRGPLIFEGVALEAFFLYSFRTACLCANRTASALAVLACAVFLMACIEGGNLAEEYALPWIAIATFIVLRTIRDRNPSLSDAALLGFSLAMVLLLRPNMIAVWLIGIPVFFHALDKEQRQKGAAALAGGLLLGLLPFLLWLASIHALQACFESYIVFNLQYTANVTEGAFGSNRLFSFAFLCFLSGSALTLLLAGCAAKKQGRPLDKPLLICVIMAFASNLTISVSGMPYPHYGMVPIPALAYPLAYFLAWLTNLKGVTESCLQGFLCGTALCLLLITGIERMQDASRTSPVLDTTAYIQEHTNPSERISVWGNSDIFYVRSQRFSASRYSYQMPIGNVDTDILEQYFHDIRETVPRILVIDSYYDKEFPENYRARIRTFLQEHDYRPADGLGNENFSVYERVEQME